jgi:hypothetical protein
MEAGETVEQCTDTSLCGMTWRERWLDTSDGGWAAVAGQRCTYVNSGGKVVRGEHAELGTSVVLRA